MNKNLKGAKMVLSESTTANEHLYDMKTINIVHDKKYFNARVDELMFYREYFFN